MLDPAPIRLRRLEVQGFKSFAARTTFEFGPGITAIVGPNGSGKSNLTDALRWVLGEQNPRALRLRKLEDVIFAGGSKRAPSGLAEVSIVLDNAEAWLPLEFAEVIVTRRLHRSGDSEYLINRSRVRLRDILDIFLKSKLGQNSYAILGQGMVETVLSLKPEERRALIEEAADVRRHRLKIDEAMDQLAATRENRDRIELLVAEIAPRLERLAKQAERAAEHQRYSEELVGCLRLLYAIRFRGLRAAAARAQSDLASAANALSQGRYCLTELEQDEARIGEQAAVAARELARQEAEWRKAADCLRETERQLGEAGERARTLSLRKTEVTAELAALEVEAASLRTETAEQSTPAMDPSRAAETAASCEADLVVANRTVDDAKRELADAEAAVRRAREGQMRLDDQLAGLEREQHRHEQDTLRLRERRQAAMGRLRSWALEFLRGIAGERDLAPLLRAARTAATDTERQAQAASAALSEAEAYLAAANSRIEDSHRRLESLERERDAQRPAEEVVVTLLDALRGGGPGRPRVLGILGGLIQVQRGMEIAVEAALAETLNALVVRTQAEALAAIEVLEQNRVGRLNFLALDEVRRGHPLNVATENGVIGVASRFIRCEESYRNLVDSLLGRIVIVDGVEAAQRIVRRGLGAAVTLAGTLLKPSGMISGGGARSDGVVFRAGRELEELQEETLRMEQDRAMAFDRVQSLREQAAAATAAQRRAASTYSDFERRQTAHVDRATGLRRSFQPLRGELEWLRAALADRSSSASGLRDQSEHLRSELATQRARDEATPGSTAPARARLESALERQKQAAERAAEARGELQALRREHEALRALAQSRRAARDRTEKLLVSRQQTLAGILAELTATQSHLVLKQSKGSELRAEVDRLAKLLDPGRTRISDLAARQRAVSASIGTKRRACAERERAHLDAQLAVQTAAHQLAGLRAELDPADWAVGVDRSAIEDVDAALPEVSEEQTERKARGLRQRIRSLGSVNEEAEADYRESRDRHDFLAAQITDLREAESTILSVVDELRRIVRDRFRATMQEVNADFQRFFRTFFGGGQARLSLTEPEDYGESGVDIIAQPSGKRLQNLATLSGGERSMTAVALLFALLESNPAPFCVLDEVDAALDESNVGRFGDALSKLAERGQFLVVTHNRGTVQAADHIYGISMTEDGVSNVLSMRLSEAASLLE